ncbi:MAG: hypothetical protein AAF483_19795 [Planctomycetota bacterium]
MPDKTRKNESDELADLLRQVDIPDDLKESLLEIPLQSSSIDAQRKADVSPGQSSLRLWLVMALAASFGAIGLFFSTRKHSPESDLAHKVIKQGNVGEHQGSDTAPADSSGLGDLILAELERRNEEIDNHAAQVELQGLRDRLSGLEGNSVVSIEQYEIESLIYAMSQEYAIPLGHSAVTVRQELTEVVNNYPNTLGALRASKTLKRMN